MIMYFKSMICMSLNNMYVAVGFATLLSRLAFSVRFARKAFNLGLLLCLGETGLVSTVTSRLAEKYTFSASSFAVTDLLAEIFVLQKFNIDTPLQDFMLM